MPSWPVAYLHMHGDRDPVIPYEGSEEWPAMASWLQPDDEPRVCPCKHAWPGVGQPLWYPGIGRTQDSKAEEMAWDFLRVH